MKQITLIEHAELLKKYLCSLNCVSLKSRTFLTSQYTQNRNNVVQVQAVPYYCSTFALWPLPEVQVWSICPPSHLERYNPLHHNHTDQTHLNLESDHPTHSHTSSDKREHLKERGKKSKGKIACSHIQGHFYKWTFPCFCLKQISVHSKT